MRPAQDDNGVASVLAIGPGREHTEGEQNFDHGVRVDVRCCQRHRVDDVLSGAALVEQADEVAEDPLHIRVDYQASHVAERSCTC